MLLFFGFKFVFQRILYAMDSIATSFIHLFIQLKYIWSAIVRCSDIKEPVEMYL